jgi:hypothetical protein
MPDLENIILTLLGLCVLLGFVCIFGGIFYGVFYA